MITVLDENYGKFGYDKNLKCQFHLWKGFLYLEEVKHVAEVMSRLTTDYELKYVIADHRNMELFSQDISDFIAKTWLPQQETFGIQNVFVVLSDEAFTKFVAEETHDVARQNTTIDIQHFTSMEDAIAAVKALAEKS
jgi:hypothetical protein